MEFETGMSVGTEYSVNAYLDPSGLYICDFNNEGLRLGQSCAGTGLGVVYVHNSFDKEKSKELYQLRGKAVCLTTVSAGGQNWIKRFSIGKCNK